MVYHIKFANTIRSSQNLSHQRNQAPANTPKSMLTPLEVISRTKPITPSSACATMHTLCHFQKTTSGFCAPTSQHTDDTASLSHICRLKDVQEATAAPHFFHRRGMLKSEVKNSCPDPELQIHQIQLKRTGAGTSSRKSHSHQESRRSSSSSLSSSNATA